MSVILYVPYKLEDQITSFQDSLGNIRVDYRGDPVAGFPHLLGTPYKELPYNFELDSASYAVPATPHITGDDTNYRRFMTDVALVPNDYQYNCLVLLTDDVIFNVTYKDTYYIELYNSNTLEYTYILQHAYIINSSTLLDEVYSMPTSPLSLSETVGTVGLVDTIPSVVFKRNLMDGASYYLSEYTDPTTSEVLPVIIYKEIVDTSFGTTGDLVDPSLVSNTFKNLEYFSSTSEEDNNYKANLVYVSEFSNTNTTFSSKGSSVLSNAYPNYYLYGQSVNQDNDIVGYTVNISPTVGALFNVVVSSDNQDYSPLADSTILGNSRLFIKPTYTGLLGSAFSLLEVTFEEDPQEYFIKLNSDAEISLGTYSEATFKDLCRSIEDVLYPYNILVIECTNNRIVLDNYGSSDIEITLRSSTASIVKNKTYFTSFLIKDKTIATNYNASYHLTNYSFNTTLDGNSVSYQFRILPNSRTPAYISNKIEIIVKPQLIVGTTKDIIIETVDGIQTATITIPAEGSTVESIVNEVSSQLSTVLGAKYTVVPKTLSSSVDIVNNQNNVSPILKIRVGDWVELNTYSGFYTNETDGSKRIRLLVNPAGTEPSGGP